MSRKYGRIKPETIVETVHALELRIHERFPGSGLAKLSAELGEIAKSSVKRVKTVNSPHRILRPMRQLIFLVSLGCCVFFPYVIYQFLVNQQQPSSEPFTWMQGVQAALAIVGIPVTIFFFLRSLEERIRRNRTLVELNDLHGILNLVDLHQLTKDPSSIMIESSSLGSRTRFELTRYLDYCSEILSLLGKVAVLYSDASDDPVVIAAVIDLEQLAAGQKLNIWMKIMLLEATATFSNVST
jgi:hypothetical protein